MKCSGVYTALITPFDENGKLDEEGLRLLVRRQVEYGVDGLVAIGTTGEAPTLSTEEKGEVISTVRKEAPNIPLMVGCGAYSTAQTLENLKTAADLGADSALVVAPYYNKPTQAGLYRHFETLAQTTPLPLLLYNIPSRACVNLETETVRFLAELPNIIGIKESSGNINQVRDVINETHPNFTVFSGDDGTTLPVIAMGGRGVVSGLANLAPHLVKELVNACQKDEMQKAREINLRLNPLYKAACLETNPIPIKAMMKICGFPSGEPRLPLTPITKHYIPVLEQVLEQTKLLVTT